jgi:hypothetical protein
VYLGIIGWRYGYVPSGQSKSVTQLEYETARQHGQRIRLYLARADAATKATFPSGTLDTASEGVEQRLALQRMLAFRQVLEREHACSEFSDVAELVRKLTSDLHRLLMEGPTGNVHLTRGVAALRRSDYASAMRDLQEAVNTIREEAEPRLAARGRYLLALAQLDGRRPFSQTFPAMRSLDGLLSSAVRIYPARTYLLTHALFKYDFARNGLPELMGEARQLAAQAAKVPSDAIDEEDMAILSICQSSLMQEYMAH